MIYLLTTETQRHRVKDIAYIFKAFLRASVPLWFFFMACGCGNVQTENRVSSQSGNLILAKEHGGNGSAWGFPSCESCHPIPAIHKDLVTSTREMVKAKGYDTCAGCHGDNGTGISRRCLICHNLVDMLTVPYQTTRHSHNFVSGFTGNLTDANCMVCHDASDMDGVFELNTDLKSLDDPNGFYTPYQSEADFCFRCHNRDHQQAGFSIVDTAYNDARVAIEDDYIHIDAHGQIDGNGAGTYSGLRDGYSYKATVNCSDCHSLHGTRNKKLIIDTSMAGVRRLSPGFRTNGYSVNTDNGDLSQLCVLCHSMTTVIDSGGTNAGNGLSGVHLVGQDCRPCHTHGEEVQAGL